MEKSINENIMPEIRLFPLLDKVAEFVGRIAGHGAKTGAAEMLDAHLYEQPELPFGDTVDRRRQPAYEPLPVIERPDAGQLTSRWNG